MQINRQALIFGGAVFTLVLLIGVGVWVSSFFSSDSRGVSGSSDSLFSSLFPFGTGSTRTGAGGAEGDQSTSETEAPRLREISRKPVSGAHFDSFGTVRYADKETGHFFETNPRSTEIGRISNSTIPGIERVIWLSDTEFALQYLDENGVLKNYIASLASSTPDQLISGKFADGVTDILPTEKPGEALFVNQNEAGTTADTVSLVSGDRERIFSSVLRSWKIFYIKNTLFLQTAPSSAAGYLYRANGARVEREVGGVPYLASLLHPSGEYVAYSANELGQQILRVANIDTGTSYQIPIRSLAHKCAWFPDKEPLLLCASPRFPANFVPESWFMGVTALNDDALWVVDPFTGIAEIKVSLEKVAGRPIDVIDLSVNPAGTHALFRNKNDLSLWSLDLEAN